MRHRFHSICPYFAMFPESFAEKWIERLTKPGDVVLDPFSGRGTTAFQALLMGRQAVACDLNEVAVCLTRAKTSPPRLSQLRRRITFLENRFVARNWKWEGENKEFFSLAFSEHTLAQLLYLRDSLRWKESAVDAMVAALALGSLHGEMDTSPSYFSNQMPRTISTKPRYSVEYWKTRGLEPPDRDVFAILSQRAAFRYQSPPPDGNALVLHNDMRDLPFMRSKLPAGISCAITSPPYFDVTNFEEDQWLRLWFLGGAPSPAQTRVASDDRHRRPDSYWSFIADMWRSLGQVLGPKASIVVRIGSSRVSPERLENALTACSKLSGRRVRRVSSEISKIKNRQTDQFRPGSRGISVEVDCRYRFID